ncbi:MAG: hypothetical protein OEW15_10745 [Nitrospirota bacterium]|nr:hypothetical protein [Nitrospirota bacterium]
MRTKQLFPVLTMILILQACSSTKVMDRWKDAGYDKGPAASLFVIGTLKNRGPRGLMEEALAKELRSRGLRATASTSVFPGEALPTRDEVSAKVTELGCDGVLVLRFLGRESGDTHTPERLYGAQPDFDETWENARAATPDTITPEVSYEFTTAVMRTMLYRVGSDKPVWSVLSRTKYQNDPFKQIAPFAAAIVSQLAGDRMIK